METYEFNTSAFLPMPATRYHRFKLHMTLEQYKAMKQRREDLAAEASETGRWGKIRAFDRRVVERYSNQR